MVDRLLTKLVRDTYILNKSWLLAGRTVIFPDESAFHQQLNLYNYIHSLLDNKNNFWVVCLKATDYRNCFLCRYNFRGMERLLPINGNK